MLGAASVVDIPWDITPEDKTRFDRFFDQLDKSGTGVLGGIQHGMSRTRSIQHLPILHRLPDSDPFSFLFAAHDIACSNHR